MLFQCLAMRAYGDNPLALMVMNPFDVQKGQTLPEEAFPKAKSIEKKNKILY